MIGMIYGNLLHVSGKTLLIDTGNIGYYVSVPLQTVSKTTIEKQIRLFTYLHVREDDLSLFGFETKEELEFFKLLLSVSGIGPKMGLEILSLPLHLVQSAIVNSNVEFLTSIHGLGGKTASRMILELKTKIKEVAVQPGQAEFANQDIVEALERLGYEKSKIYKVLQDMPYDIQKEEDILKYCLQHLS